MNVRSELIWKRLLEYASYTGVTISRMPRYSEKWKAFGLPDTRGFVPHLRTVNLGVGDLKSPLWKNPWLAHDLMHVLFYDYAELNLGAEAFAIEQRMLETHLASEAFAVYALDYRVLSSYPGKTLTIDLDRKLWPRFQKLNPALKALESPEFCQALVNHYLSGETGDFTADTRNAQYQTWAGHEIRYAVKQRYYAQMWADDLSGVRRESPVVAEIFGSFVHEAVFDLSEVLLTSDAPEWKSFLDNVQSLVSRPRVLGIFKEKSIQDTNFFDYRFTDMLSIPKVDVLSQVQHAKEPSAATLFLLWQVIATTEPDGLTTSELKMVRELARTANEKVVSIRAWRAVRDLSLRLIQTRSWTPVPERRASFFLP